MPKSRNGAAEAIRTLMVATRSARHERTQAIDQARALILTGPDELRTRFAGKRAASLAGVVTALRLRPGDAAEYSLRELGRRVQFRDDQIERLDDLIIPLVTGTWPPQPLRDRPGHGRAAAHRGRRPAGAAAERGRLGAYVRCRPNPRILGQDPVGTASTAAGTGIPTTPCGGSRSPR